jgi:hypothetical protein
MEVAMSPFDTAGVNGTVVGISVYGDGASNASAEMVIQFKPISPPTSQPMAIRVGAGSAPQVFAALCQLAIYAFKTREPVTVTAVAVPPNTPVLTGMVIPAQ